MDRSVELELRSDIKEMRDEMNKGFKDLSVQLAKVTTKQNIGTWFFQMLVTVAVGGLGGYFSAHIPR